MKSKQCNRVRTVPTSNRQVVEKDTLSIFLTQKGQIIQKQKAQIQKRTNKSPNKYIFNQQISISCRNTLHGGEEEHAGNIRVHQNEHQMFSYKKIDNLLMTANADGINRGLQ